jgi:transcriptional regulator with XRE-family HTH domain
MPLGDRIKEKRKAKKLTQEKLAQRLNISASYLSQIEKETRNPTYALLRELGAELDAPVEYLVGGKVSGIEDPSSRMITSAVRFLNEKQRGQLLEYLYFLTGSKNYLNFPFYDSPADYARYILQKYNINTPPIDPFHVAELLNVKIVFSRDDSTDEGVLYKEGSHPLIVINSENKNTPRLRFTVAMMLGHLVIPWHLRSVFCRRREGFSQEENDQLGIEAREFAGALLIQPQLLKRDFRKIEPGLANFEDLAYNRYGCSLLIIAQKYVQFHSKNSALITSIGEKITRVYRAGFPYQLSERISGGSCAYSFVTDPPPEKEIRKGILNAATWIVDPPRGMRVYEESLLDPLAGVTVTLLLITRGNPKKG